MLPQSRVIHFAYPRKLRHQHSTYQIESNQSPTENIYLDNIRKGDTTIMRKYKRTWNGQSLKDRKPNYIVWLIPVYGIPSSHFIARAIPYLLLY